MDGTTAPSPDRLDECRSDPARGGVRDVDARRETARAAGSRRVDEDVEDDLVSVLVSVYNEADSIQPLATQVIDSLDRVQEHADGSPVRRWELVFVDDGSSDGTWERIGAAAADDPRVRGVRLRRNVGKSTALAAGLRSSRGGLIVTMDGDLQDDPAEVPGMLARVGQEADLVAGHKADRKDPLTKTLPSRVFNRVTSAVTGLRLRDHNCGLKVGTRGAFESVPLYGEMHRFLAAICHAQGYEVVEHSVNHRPRQHGRSKFGAERYVRGALDLLTVVMLTRYSRRPAHLFGGVGIGFGLVGALILLYLTGVWFLTDQPIGGRPLLLLGILLAILAVQLMSLGVLAELLVSRQASAEDPRRHVAETT